jgi:hypothetical protein
MYDYKPPRSEKIKESQRKAAKRIRDKVSALSLEEKLKGKECKFYARVATSDAAACWEWQGSLHKQGYGLFAPMTGALIRAHRAAYYYWYGVDPKELQVCHSCDNPRCVNPQHLFLGTPADNHTDMVKKGRASFQKPYFAPYRKLTEKDVVAILSDSRPNKIIADEYGVTHSNIHVIKRRKSWKHVTQQPGSNYANV